MVNGERLTFEVLGLYLDVFMMADRQTGTVWAHLDGKASQGPLAGERLAFVPLPQMTWGEWLRLHPDTLVLDPDTPFADRYRAVRIGRPNPREALIGDGRLPSNTLVVGVEVKGRFAGFPIEALEAAGGVVNAEVGGEPVVVVYDVVSRTGIAYSAVLDGRPLHFEAVEGADGLLLADANGTTWRTDGVAVAGPQAGAQLIFVPSFISEWYGWSGYHPDTALYTGLE